MNLETEGSILLVENEPDDVFIFQRSVKKVGITNSICTVENGELAIDYLSERLPGAGKKPSPLPKLVLLDLSMPRMGGIEVLKWIRNQPDIKKLIVIVLTSSQKREDVNSAYEHGANGYLVKPVGSSEFHSLLTSIKSYWLDYNQNPTFDSLL